MAQEQICEECKIVVYEWNEGKAMIRPHKPTCSKRGVKDNFFVGDFVRRKKEYQDPNAWLEMDKVLKVRRVNDGSLFFYKEEMHPDSWMLSAKEKYFEKVISE